MLAIVLVPEEAPWSGPDSFRATVEVNPHISWGLGQFAGTVFEVVVVDNVGTVVDVDVVDMVVGDVVEDIVADDVDDLVVEAVDNLVVKQHWQQV